MPTEILIIAGSTQIRAELNDSETAREVVRQLPLEAQEHRGTGGARKSISQFLLMFLHPQMPDLHLPLVSSDIGHRGTRFVFSTDRRPRPQGQLQPWRIRGTRSDNHWTTRKSFEPFLKEVRFVWNWLSGGQVQSDCRKRGTALRQSGE